MAGQGVVGGRWSGSSSARNANVCGWPGTRSSTTSRRLPISAASSSRRPAQATGQDQVTVDRLVVAAQKPWRVPGGCPAPLPFVEEGVGHRREVLEGGHQRRREVGTVDRDRRVKSGMDHRRSRDADPGRGRSPQPLHAGTDVNLAKPVSQLSQLARRDPAHGGQVGPLVLVRLHGGRVQEHGGAVPAAPALQRCRDQVAQAAGLKHVLGGEQPVVAGQAHPSPQCQGFTQQPGADLTCQGRRNRGGEEQPGVRAGTRPGHLKGDRAPAALAALR